MSFIAFRINQDSQDVQAGFHEMEIDQLTPGQVIVRVNYSGINYKDALAATGKGRILRIPAVNGGIDLAGEVVSSDSDRFKSGDRVLACGYGLSETLDGGYAEYARLDPDHLVVIPDGLTDREAMSIGTAGFTAALALIMMEVNGQTVDHGSILVTGASGGVGSIAVNLFSMLGYNVTAVTGKAEAIDYLRELGSSNFLDRISLDMGTRPLEKAKWGGAIDNVGGELLSWITRTIRPRGNIASIGLVGSATLETTVIPFILRGISMLGINCNVPLKLRDEIWQRLGSDLKPSRLDLIANRTIKFTELPTMFDQYLGGGVIGRTVVKIRD